jgi:hypothetical protein
MKTSRLPIRYFPLCFLIVSFTTSARLARSAELAEVPMSELSFHPKEDFNRSSDTISDRKEKYIFATGLAAFVAARYLDPSVRDHWAGTHPLGSSTDFTNNVLGTGVPGVIAGGAFWIYGYEEKRPHEVHAGQAELEALAATGILTEAIKFGAQRERPDSSDRHSFPSGHTSTVFASATVFEEFYGWKAGVPLYALGVLTAVGRIVDNRHWLSDTVGGAVLGSAIGHAVARGNLASLNSEVKFSVAPIVTENERLLEMQIKF